MTVPSRPAEGLGFELGLDLMSGAPSLYCILKAQLVGRRESSSLLHSPPSALAAAFLFRGRVRLVIPTRATMEALASASPRKPNVCMDLRSSTSTNLEVAKRVHANGKSRGEMPVPLSVTDMESRPPRWHWTSIWVLFWYAWSFN